MSVFPQTPQSFRWAWPLGLCPGPAGDRMRSPDPSPTHAPPPPNHKSWIRPWLPKVLFQLAHFHRLTWGNYFLELIYFWGDVLLYFSSFVIFCDWLKIVVIRNVSRLEKIWFFGVKSWFFTRNTPKMFPPPSTIGKIWFFGVKS